VKTFIVALSIVGFACAISMPADASPIKGAQFTNDVLGRNMQHSFDLVLKKEEPTFMMVTGDGESDIDCFLYDENHHLLAKDDDRSSQCVIVITPRWAGHFTLIVQNVGTKQTFYAARVF
jgi:hypothetical protein